MKIKPVVIIFILISISAFACETVKNIYDSNVLTNEEVIRGLREALTVGTDTSVHSLHATDGYYTDQAVKILLPAEAKVVYDNIALIPGGKTVLEEVVKKVNRAAEDAAVEAKPIFVGAIKNITIGDGFVILRGTDTAATHYLKSTTYDSLTAVFKPRIQSSLRKAIVGTVSAESAYTALIDNYNKAARLANMIPGSQYAVISSNSLSEYTTRRALDGLFLKIADEEKAIRQDPAARVNAILKKVFSERLH
ncbi:MAG: DUF4197 domain-containing protein [Cytophagales bacterium]|nr:DUF4197 domain-containing protein [Cytophaga sp.]